jgi:hypothetical protein
MSAVRCCAVVGGCRSHSTNVDSEISASVEVHRKPLQQASEQDDSGNHPQRIGDAMATYHGKASGIRSWNHVSLKA